MSIGKIELALKQLLIVLVVIVQSFVYSSGAGVLAMGSPDSPGATPTPTVVDPTPAPTPVPTTVPTPIPTTTPTQSPSPTPIVTPTPQGPTQPTGPSDRTYTFNTATGLWENDFYTWNPATKQTSPKTEKRYSYNPATGLWDTLDWTYNARTGKYEPNIIASTPAPSNPSSQKSNGSGLQSNSTSGSGSTTPISSAALLATPSLTGGSKLSVDPTGPGSNNTINLDNSTNHNFDLFFNAKISNTIDSNATSGNASVSHNTTGGSALTGDALSMANIVNLLQSSWNLGKDNFNVFKSDINGNVFGDIMIDPGQLGNTNVNAKNTGNLSINAKNNGQITNDVNLNAQSGNANVSGNTKAGDATTGSASAVANILNFMNSMVSSGKSFLGTININGDLNGDILLPQNMINALLASNAFNAPGTALNASQDKTLDINNTNNSTINNNVATNATSGNAAVVRNTTAGNATTGASNTKITLLNLTGHQVVADNALLVFVNVLGHWTGLIMNAPAGATSAALAGNVTKDSTVNLSNDANAKINIENNNNITNNVNTNAVSGDASVNNNTKGGNATSGNTSASANIANIIGSQFSLAKWFGVLFINVFGTWEGSFGVNTAAGNAPTPVPSPTGSPTTGATAGAVKPNTTFSFVPKTAKSTTKSAGTQVAAQEQIPSPTPKETKNDAKVLGVSNKLSTPTGKSSFNPLGFLLSPVLWFMIVAGLVAGLAAFAKRRLIGNSPAIKPATIK